MTSFGRFMSVSPGFQRKATATPPDLPTRTRLRALRTATLRHPQWFGGQISVMMSQEKEKSGPMQSIRAPFAPLGIVSRHVLAFVIAPAALFFFTAIFGV